jgi:hypothetical protein
MLVRVPAQKAVIRFLTRFPIRPLFRAIHLGDKYPTVDFMVDALDAADYSRGFFFVQVTASSV